MAADLAPRYFISDLHLDASRVAVTEAFRTFITEISLDASAIYILGDFVDAWIGDDNHSPYIENIKSLLAARTSSGTSIYFTHGNRDFLIGDKFATETGVVLLEENTVIDLYGEKALLLHGDSLCTSDVAYQNFRKKVRDPRWQRKMLRYPLWVRKLIAAYMRYRSRVANTNKAENILDVSPEAVSLIFSQFEVNKIIHGHTHRPNRHHLEIAGEPCERIVLGDWEKSGWYLRADPKDQELIQFTI